MIIEHGLEGLDSQPITTICSRCQGSGQVPSYERNLFRLHSATDAELAENQVVALTCPDCVCGVCLTAHGKKIAQQYAKSKQTEFVEFGNKANVYWDK